MTSNQSLPNNPEFRVAGVDRLLSNPSSPYLGVAAAFAVLFCVFAIANAWPLVLAAIYFVALKIEPSWEPIAELPTFGQWFQWTNGTWPPEIVLIPVVLLIEGPRFWKLCFGAAAFYVVLLFLYLAGAYLVEPGSMTITRQICFTSAGLFVSLAATFAHFRLIRGWRLVGRHWNGTLPTPRRVRFTLRQMFIATAVFGGFMAFSAYSDLFRFAIAAAMFGQFAGLPLLAARGNRMTTWIDWGLIAIVLVFLGAVTVMDTKSGRPATNMFASWYAVCVFSHLWLRLWGLRLRCAQPPAKSGTQPSVHAIPDLSRQLLS